jgi:outer membrane PBP1 activator LpoA protein
MNRPGKPVQHIALLLVFMGTFAVMSSAIPHGFTYIAISLPAWLCFVDRQEESSFPLFAQSNRENL